MRIGMFVSMGLGGADKCTFNLVKGLLEIEEIELLVFYNKFSLPTFVESVHNKGYVPISRFDDYNKITKLIKIEDTEELGNYDLDILHTHRPGDDSWLLPNFESIDFNFKIVETNFHGACLTKADHRTFPSKAMIENKPITGSYDIVYNAIDEPRSSENLRVELGLQDKFVFGRITRPESDIYTPLNLEAYSKIENEDNFFIYVAPCEQAVEDAKRLGIKNIIFLEPTIDIEHLSKIYNTFDLHCHSNNIGETFGNTLAESMIHGVPSITHIGFNRNWPQAQKELLKDFDELCINLTDYDTMINEYSNMMTKFMTDEEYYNKIKLFYYNESKKYLYDNIAIEYLNLYKNILKKTGWLVNDCLTCIPGTKTFWHDLLENVDGLVDKCDGHTSYNILPTKIENEIRVGSPDYIIRNATFFRKMNTSVPTITLLQDVVVDRNIQIDTCNSSTVTVFNSQYTKSLYPEIVNSVVIPLGTDFEKFKPLDNIDELKLKYGINDNTILYVGSSSIYPKGFDMIEAIINSTDYDYVLIMKDDYQSSNPRVKVFNRIAQDEIVEIANCCSMLLCTSKEETLHLGGVESAACGLPIITTNVGIYPSIDGEGWGHICDSLEMFLQTIELVFKNIDSYNPREVFFKNGLDKKTAMKCWNMLIDRILIK